MSASTGPATLRVTAPADAVVYVNDHKTSSTGTDRHYVSNGLRPDRTYTYRVRVEYEQDGERVIENKVATLTAGGDARLDFSPSAPLVAEEETTTKLTLAVPADAKVILAGAETRRTGEVREFATTRLAPGESWEGYTVRVAVGDEIQERTITLRGGESQRLEFRFDGEKLAAN